MRNYFALSEEFIYVKDMDGANDDDRRDDKIHDRMNYGMPMARKSAFVGRSSPAEASATSRCRKLSVCHVGKALLILSAFCFCDPVNGQDLLKLKYRLEEEQSAGTYVGNVFDDANLGKIYDLAALQQLQFRFLQPQNFFMIDNATGIIRTNSPIDREAICPSAVNCDIRIDVVLQPQPFFRIIRASVTILDINDNWPQFDRDEQIVEVSESAAVGTILLVPSAIDLDSPEFSTQSYSLVSDFERFELVGRGRRPDGTSESKLMLTKSLDRETVDRYNLQIVAVDGGYPKNSGSMDVVVHVLDVNDNNPVFEKDNYTIAVMENIQKQTSILRIHAVDADIGRNGEVVYSLSLPSLAAYGNLFGTDNSTGDLYVKGDLDFEENSIYFLTVVARDRGADSIPVSASVTILVGDANDNAPEITIATLSPSTETAEIAENSAANTFVAHLTIVDKDSGDNGRFDCYLNDSHFHIIETYGAEYQIVTAAPLDREVQSSYNLTLTCADFGDKPQISVKYLRVLITDLNDCDPVFTQPIYRAELIENNYIGAVLMRANASDRDSDKNGAIIYRLSGDAAQWFHVEPDTGLVTAAISFDRENDELIRFQIVASDQGNPARFSSAEAYVAILDVNDEKPVFSHPAYSFAVMENLAPGAEVGAVAAHDRDSSVYGEVTYFILAADGSDLFDIDHKTGLIATMRVLDREAVSAYYLTVVASDRGIPPLSSSATVTVYVTDENDNSPVFDYPAQNNNTIYISNQTPQGHVITRIRAHDADVGQNGKIAYDITAESKTEMFDLDMELGTVIVNGDLTDLDGRQYLLEVVARDEGLPPKTAFARLNIIVNRSVVFAAEDLEQTMPQSTLVIVLMAAISVVVIVVLIAAIVVICRKDREKQTHSYNCRTETLKMFSKSKKPMMSDVSDFSGRVEHGAELRSKKELSLGMEELDVELSDERSPRSASTCQNKYVVQNPQASNSLLRNNSLANSYSNAEALPSQSTSISKFARGDYHGSQTVPLLQQNKEAEASCYHHDNRRLSCASVAQVNRLIRALNDNDRDSIHSGEGSNTDSGHGPSEEGESNANTARPMQDHHRNPLQVEFSKASKPERVADGQLQVNSGYHSNSQLAPDFHLDVSHTSSHSYSSQNPSVTLSTFGPRCFYGPDSAAVINMAAEDARPNVGLGFGFVQSTPGSHPVRSNSHVGLLTSPVLPNGFPQSVRYGNRSGNVYDDLSYAVGKCQASPGRLGPSLERMNNKKNSQDYTQNVGSITDRQRVLHNTSCPSDSDCTGVQYSCADMSAALHEICTPMADTHGSRTTCEGDNDTVTTASYIIDPYDLCDQIDDLFFRDNMAINYTRPR